MGKYKAVRTSKALTFRRRKCKHEWRVRLLWARGLYCLKCDAKLRRVK